MKSKLAFAVAVILAIMLPTVSFAASFGTQNFFYAPSNVITPLPGFTTSWGGGGLTSIANGGTATSTQVTNGVNYFDGTHITSGTALTWNGTTLTANQATTTGNTSLNSTGYPFVQVGTPAAQQYNLQVDTTGQSSYASLGTIDSGNTGQVVTDNVDSFNGITGFTSLVSSNTLALGWGGHSTICGLYDDNTLDTLFDCYPPSGGDEMTYTASLPQTNGTDFVDHGLMNYSTNTGLQAFDYYAKTTKSSIFPSVYYGWWDSALGQNSATAYLFMAASTTESGTYGTTTAIALGDVATSSFSSANGVNLSGATIQIISSSSRPTLLTVSENKNNSLTQIFSVNQSGATTTNLTDNGYLCLSGVCNSSWPSAASSTLLTDNNTFSGSEIFNTSPSVGVNTNGLLLGGNIWAYASSTNGATLFGIAAGGNNATTSNTLSGTTAFGYQALQSLNTGLSNVAFGYQAMLNATSTPQNIAIGYQALKGSATISSTGENTAIGYLAMTAYTSAQNNTAIGWQALKGVTTGNSNVAIGVNSLLVDAGGGQNVAVGQAAGSTISSGASNVAVGYSALLNDTSGAQNTSLGRETLNFNQTGGNDVAIGYRAGFGVTGNSFSDNVLLGFQNGFSLTTGGQNVYIGSQTASTTASGTGNIAIGYDISGPQAATNGSNMLDIGNLIFGNGMTSQASSSPAGTFSIGSSTNSLAAGNSFNTTNGVCHAEKAAGTTSSYDYFYYVAGSATPVYQSTPCSGAATTTIIED